MWRCIFRDFLVILLRRCFCAAAREARHLGPCSLHHFLLNSRCAGAAHSSEQYFCDRRCAKKYGAGQAELPQTEVCCISCIKIRSHGVTGPRLFPEKHSTSSVTGPTASPRSPRAKNFSKILNIPHCFVRTLGLRTEQLGNQGRGLRLTQAVVR